MTNIFQWANKKLQGSTFIIWIFMVVVMLLMASINFVVEDASSSREGITLLEQVFGVRPVNHDITYWTISITPQLVQIVFMYLFLLEPRKNWWALVVVGLFFSLDFVADLQQRSNGMLFNEATGFTVNSTVTVAAMFTILFYTIGSELFMTVTMGLILELLPATITQTAVLIGKTKDKLAEARGMMRGNERQQPPQQQRQQSRQQQPRQQQQARPPRPDIPPELLEELR